MPQGRPILFPAGSAMAKPMSRLSFAVHLAYFRLRDRFLAPERVLRDAGVQPGQAVVDYGCGGGSYSLAAARIVGEAGRVWAVDYSPLALREVRRQVRARGLANVETIETDQATGLPDQSADMVLMYDVFHALDDPAGVLAELHRVLKPGGVLSVRHHHTRPELVISAIAATGLFAYVGTTGGTITFRA